MQELCQALTAGWDGVVGGDPTPLVEDFELVWALETLGVEVG
jgi:hypothetical protein